MITNVTLQKTTEPVIKIPFGMYNWVDPYMNDVLDGAGYGRRTANTIERCWLLLYHYRINTGCCIHVGVDESFVKLKFHGTDTDTDTDTNIRDARVIL